MSGVEAFTNARNEYTDATQSLIQTTLNAAHYILANVNTDVTILIWYVFGARNDERYIELKNEFHEIKDVKNLGVPHNAVFIFLDKFITLLKELNFRDGTITYNVEGFDADSSYYFKCTSRPNIDNVPSHGIRC